MPVLLETGMSPVKTLDGSVPPPVFDCLDELRSFHDANPDHEVVTVFLDIKDAWQTSVNPTDFDARIRSHLPDSMVFKPANWLWNQSRQGLASSSHGGGKIKFLYKTVIRRSDPA